MKYIGIYLSTIFLILSILYSKINIYNNSKLYQKNNSFIVRYGKNVESGDIIKINGQTEIVIEVNEDFSYITKTK